MTRLKFLLTKQQLCRLHLNKPEHKSSMGCNQSKSIEDSVDWDKVPSAINISSDSDSSVDSQSSSDGPIIVPAISKSHRLYIPNDIIFSFNSIDRSIECALEREKRVLVNTYNRQGIPCVKATHTEQITFEMLIHSLKHAKKDEQGRLIANGSVFWRSPEMEALRVADYEQDKKKYANTSDRLHIETFGWDAVKNADGKITAVRGKNATREIVWMRNKYPYAWEDGLQHYVCWSTDAPAQSIDECIRNIKENIGHDKEAVWFTNSSKNRSVPGIDHIHVIVRRKRWSLL
jgi:predicted DNA-binding protein (UPF0251 family)